MSTGTNAVLSVMVRVSTRALRLFLSAFSPIDFATARHSAAASSWSFDSWSVVTRPILPVFPGAHGNTALGGGATGFKPREDGSGSELS